MERPTDALHKVRQVLLAVAPPSVPADAIHEHTSILELGLTSLNLIDLAIALEDAFGLQEFPLQDWLDSEVDLGERGFTVASLVRTCQSLR